MSAAAVFSDLAPAAAPAPAFAAAADAMVAATALARQQVQEFQQQPGTQHSSRQRPATPAGENTGGGGGGDGGGDGGRRVRPRTNLSP